MYASNSENDPKTRTGPLPVNGTEETTSKIMTVETHL